MQHGWQALGLPWETMQLHSREPVPLVRSGHCVYGQYRSSRRTWGDVKELALDLGELLLHLTQELPECWTHSPHLPPSSARAPPILSAGSLTSRPRSTTSSRPL